MFSTEERFVLDTFLLFNYVKKWNKIKKKRNPYSFFYRLSLFQAHKEIKMCFGASLGENFKCTAKYANS